MCVYPTQQLTTLIYTLHCYLGRWQRQVQMHQDNTIAQIQLQHHLHFRPTFVTAPKLLCSSCTNVGQIEQCLNLSQEHSILSARCSLAVVLVPVGLGLVSLPGVPARVAQDLCELAVVQITAEHLGLASALVVHGCLDSPCATAMVADRLISWIDFCCCDPVIFLGRYKWGVL
jgi:hypothetical protein